MHSALFRFWRVFYKSYRLFRGNELFMSQQHPIHRGMGESGHVFLFIFDPAGVRRGFVFIRSQKGALVGALWITPCFNVFWGFSINRIVYSAVMNYYVPTISYTPRHGGIWACLFIHI